MSNLPQNKKLIRVIYEFENNEQYEVTGEASKNFQDNIKSASVMTIVHAGSFKPVDQKKLLN